MNVFEQVAHLGNFGVFLFSSHVLGVHLDDVMEINTFLHFNRKAFLFLLGCSLFNPILKRNGDRILLL